MTLTANATLKKANVKAGSDGYYGQGGKASLLELAFEVELPRPKTIPAFEAWLGQGTWRYEADRTQRACLAARGQGEKPKGAKKCADVEDCEAWVVKGAEHKHSIPCDHCQERFPSEEALEEHDCAQVATCKSCGKEIIHDAEDDEDACRCAGAWCCGTHEAEYRGKYAAEVAERREHNRTAFEATQHAGIFLALLNTPVRVTLEPQQGGLADMFPMLAAAAAEE